jgi:hypothetical protein
MAFNSPIDIWNRGLQHCEVRKIATIPENSKAYIERGGIAIPLCHGRSDVDLFGYGESVVHLNAEIADGALDLGIPNSSCTARKLPVRPTRLTQSRRYEHGAGYMASSAELNCRNAPNGRRLAPSTYSASSTLPGLVHLPAVRVISALFPTLR